MYNISHWIYFQAAHDFSDTDAMLRAGEELFGPYVWGIYDILVMPPSFSSGGMEHPCVNFMSPTLLSGDKARARNEPSRRFHNNRSASLGARRFRPGEGPS